MGAEVQIRCSYHCPAFVIASRLNIKGQRHKPEKLRLINHSNRADISLCLPQIQIPAVARTSALARGQQQIQKKQNNKFVVFKIIN
jgi:hypothetical protein